MMATSHEIHRNMVNDQIDSNIVSPLSPLLNYCFIFFQSPNCIPATFVNVQIVVQSHEAHDKSMHLFNRNQKRGSEYTESMDKNSKGLLLREVKVVCIFVWGDALTRNRNAHVSDFNKCIVSEYGVFRHDNSLVELFQLHT